ncbi:hypothetical protein [Tenacibaculum sp. M341]|uniref:hypothetical protein n=1 Tax=Tenacibaculum sp. M341 TaxID=2530339 RepID=UPI001050F40A|nr:hypothetical protein [Tenacibaculum sp. M341]TCI85060.1 hypothetical protein EYW44_18740 [Tenacibaculum sp. M341]
MENQDINNWKLLEVIDEILIVDEKSQNYIKDVFDEINIPKTSFEDGNRVKTQINWVKIPTYNKFFFDNEGDEKENEIALRNSKLSNKENLIITYGWNEPAIKISTQKFIDEWEDFIASTHWETIIFSEDLELIIEVSRDYFMHSNFLIK